MKYVNYLLLFTAIVLLACKPNKADGNEVNNYSAESQDLDTSRITPIAKKPIEIRNKEYNRVALFLAGISQIDSNYFTQKEKLSVWQTHQFEMNKLWDKADKNRLNKLQAWRDSCLNAYIIDTLPLFYPFAGGDFLHAWHFYPKASSYHLIAMENIRMLPDFINMDESDLNKYLSNLRNSLRDVIGKSYFITKHMETDLKSDEYSGLVPLYLVFAVRTGHTIVDFKTIKLDSLGLQVKEQSDFYGINMQITNDGFTEKTLSYMKFDLGNKNIESNPHFAKWVESIGEKNVFLKAASYLPHYKTFENIRQLMMNNTSSIFQDDSGIAYRYIDTTLFETKLFGSYTRPIDDFSDVTYQKDLALLFEKTPVTDRKAIPFPLGYHVVGDKIQNHQLFKKRN